MRIPKKCQYALRALFELALCDPGQPVRIHQIAAAQNIPARFLEAILNQLRHAGIVESRRGNEGGYMLARAPEDLTVGEVIRCIQGPIVMTGNDELEPDSAGAFYGDHAFKQLWDDIDGAISAVCDSTTFAELVEYEKATKMTPAPNYSI